MYIHTYVTHGLDNGNGMFFHATADIRYYVYAKEAMITLV